MRDLLNKIIDFFKILVKVLQVQLNLRLPIWGVLIIGVCVMWVDKLLLGGFLAVFIIVVVSKNWPESAEDDLLENDNQKEEVQEVQAEVVVEEQDEGE